MGRVRVPTPPLPGGRDRDARVRAVARRGRGAVGRRRAPARHGLRAPPRPRDRPPARGARGAREDGRRSGRHPRDRVARGLPRCLARLADGEDALRGRRALGLPAGVRVRAARGHRRADAEVGEEEAQATELRRGREPRRGPAGRRGARGGLRRARALRDRGARGARRRARRPGLRRPGVSASGRYARILRTPHVLPLMAAALLARLPIGIDSLAIVLFVRQTAGSYATAGLVSATFALGVGAGAPLSGRLIDRYGQRRVLVPLALVHAGGLALLVGLVLVGAPNAVVGPAALLAGLAIPPISATLRPLWGPMLRDDPELLPTAYALDSVLIEFVFVFGPLLTAVATALLSPVAALAAAAVLVVGGTFAFVASPPSRAWRPEPAGSGRRRLGALGSPGLRTLVAATL